MRPKRRRKKRLQMPACQMEENRQSPLTSPRQPSPFRPRRESTPRRSFSGKCNLETKLAPLGSPRASGTPYLDHSSPLRGFANQSSAWVHSFARRLA